MYSITYDIFCSEIKVVMQCRWDMCEFWQEYMAQSIFIFTEEKLMKYIALNVHAC